MDNEEQPNGKYQEVVGGADGPPVQNSVWVGLLEKMHVKVCMGDSPPIHPIPGQAYIFEYLVPIW